jgi:hypothetical protein
MSRQRRGARALDGRGGTHISQCTTSCAPLTSAPGKGRLSSAGSAKGGFEVVNGAGCTTSCAPLASAPGKGRPSSAGNGAGSTSIGSSGGSRGWEDASCAKDMASACSM